tara:strand:- start:6124 stop:6336 length:213 start_codon:yes stop_codon:yes gene_type:complete
MNTSTTLIYRENYEVVVDAYITEEDLEISNITYHCNKSAQAIDITDFLYDFLDTASINDMEQKIIDNSRD